MNDTLDSVIDIFYLFKVYIIAQIKWIINQLINLLNKSWVFKCVKFEEVTSVYNKNNYKYFNFL